MAHTGDRAWGSDEKEVRQSLDGDLAASGADASLTNAPIAQLYLMLGNTLANSVWEAKQDSCTAARPTPEAPLE